MKVLIIISTLLFGSNIYSQQVNLSFGIDGILVFDETVLTENPIYGSLINGIEKVFFINDKFYFVQSNKIIAFNQEGALDSAFNEVGILNLGIDFLIGDGFTNNEKLSLYGCVRNEDHVDFILLNLDLSGNLHVTEELFLTEPETQIEPFHHIQTDEQIKYILGRKTPVTTINTPPENEYISASIIAKFEDESNPNIGEVNFLLFEEIQNLVYYQKLNNSKHRLYFLSEFNPSIPFNSLNYIDIDFEQSLTSEWLQENKVNIGSTNGFGIQKIIPLNNQKSLIVWSDKDNTRIINGFSLWDEQSNLIEDFSISELIEDHEVVSIHSFGEKILITGNKLTSDSALVSSLLMIDKDLNLDKTFGNVGTFNIPLFHYEKIKPQQNPILINHNLYWFGEGNYFGETNDLFPEISSPLDLDHFSIEIDLNKITANNEVVENSLSIYPSVTNDIIYLSPSNVKEINVYNQSGKLCLRKQNPDNSLDVSNLPSGLYFLSAIGKSNRIHTQRFVKK